MAKTITHQDNDETKPALFGEADHLDYAKNHTFTQMIFEMLTEKTPTDSETKLLDLILQLSIDHGPNAPSAVETIKSAKEGKTTSEALSQGILQINERHGGAAEPLMKILYKVKNSELEVKTLVEEYLKEGKRMPGFGHRVYKNEDPRAQLILKTAAENNLGGEYAGILREIEAELEKQKGTKLPINIDGAIAAVLCAFGLDPKLGIVVFLIARVPGLLSHYINNS